MEGSVFERRLRQWKSGGWKGIESESRAHWLGCSLSALQTLRDSARTLSPLLAERVRDLPSRPYSSSLNVRFGCLVSRRLRLPVLRDISQTIMKRTTAMTAAAVSTPCKTALLSSSCMEVQAPSVRRRIETEQRRMI